MKKLTFLLLIFCGMPAKSDYSYNYAIHIWGNVCDNGSAVISIRNSDVLSINTCNGFGYPLFATNGAHVHSPPQKEIDSGLDLLLSRGALEAFSNLDGEKINDIASFLSRTLETNKDVLEILNDPQSSDFMMGCLEDFYKLVKENPDSYKNKKNERRYLTDEPSNKLGCSLVYFGTSYINSHNRQQPVASIEASELVLVLFTKASDGSNIINFIPAEAVRRYGQCKVCIYPDS